MKIKKRWRSSQAVKEIQTTFTRGVLATGLLAILQDKSNNSLGNSSKRTIVRKSLQGGAALAAGTVAAEALWQRRYGLAATAFAVGVAGVLIMDAALQDGSSQAPLQELS